MCDIKVVNCRVQELRKLGYKNLEDFVQRGNGNHLYVGRDMTFYVPAAVGSKWKNPYTLKSYGNDAEKVISLYKDYVKRTPSLLNDLHELEGKTLACWCYPAPCHATALKELVEENCFIKTS